jgi:beta-galactosidase
VTFQRNFSFVKQDFDDKGWPVATLPHDPLINQTFNQSAGLGAAFLPRTVVWYRKHFSIPKELCGQHIYLYFEGAFQFSEIYLNGQHVQDHNVGYTTFTVRLDNSSSLSYGPGKTNVLAVRVDPSFGSGHWYEGGGINRPVQLVIAPMVHFVEGGIYANPNSDGTSLRVSVEIEDLTDHLPSIPTSPWVVTLVLRDRAGTAVATTQQPVHANDTLANLVLRPSDGKKLQTWSPQTPVTYTLTACVGDDQVNLTTAVRTFEYAAKAKLNGHQIELQGFSHHPSFAGMGAMTNPRLGLFTVQTTKALGMNFWRNSHNPYEDAIYELLTTAGVMCWDENRNFGSSHANEYHDMIKAHRNHAAVMLWGLCNEGQCRVENGNAAEAFMQVKSRLDPERPQTGNMVAGAEYNFPHLDIIAGIV